jgi:hypothetical protein
MGRKVDRSADVYALGVMAFECLTGRVPYTGTTPVAILMKHVQEPVPEPPASELAVPLSTVVRRCLAKTPEERWPSAGAFVAALDQAAAGATAGAGLAPLTTLELPPTPASGMPSPLPRKLLWVAAGGVAGLAVLALALRLLVPTPSGPHPAGAVPAPAPPPSRAAEPKPDPPTTPPLVTAAAATVSRPAGKEALPTPAPTPEANPAPTPGPATLRASGGRIRVFCEAKLEPVLFRKADSKDVADSLKDLKEAIAEHGTLDLVPRDEADAVVQVLERGREPALIGMRKVRVRIVLGRESVELTGQDSMRGFNTWSGAANGAAKRVEAWLKRRLAGE